MAIRSRWTCWLLLALGFNSNGCGDEEKKQGGEGQACFPNETCNAGFDCRSNVCVDLDGKPAEADLADCWSCGASSCGSESDSCQSASGCADALECQVRCGADQNCLAQCDVSGLDAEGLSALSSFYTCAASSCLDECINTSSGASPANPDAPPPGPGGAGGEVDLGPCLQCGRSACATEAEVCENASGCSEILECQLGCGADQTCISGCDVTGLNTSGLNALSDYFGCVIISCPNECTASTAIPDPKDPVTPPALPPTPDPDVPVPPVTGVDGLFDGRGVWIDRTNNMSGIQGSFFVLQDSVDAGQPVSDGLVHTELTPQVFVETTPSPCVGGTLAKVTDASGGSCELSTQTCEWTALWGGGIGLNLNETGGTDSVKSPWNATENGVSGFTFMVSGNLGGATLRFKAKMEGSNADFCTPAIIGSNSVMLSELTHNCFDGGVASEVLDVTKLTQLEWQFVPDASNSYPIADFCIESVDKL